MRCVDLEWEMGDLTLCSIAFAGFGINGVIASEVSLRDKIQLEGDWTFGWNVFAKIGEIKIGTLKFTLLNVSEGSTASGHELSSLAIQ